MLNVAKYSEEEVAKIVINYLQNELDLSNKYCELNIPSASEEELNNSLRVVLNYIRDCNEDYLED